MILLILIYYYSMTIHINILILNDKYYCVSMKCIIMKPDTVLKCNERNIKWIILIF